MNASRRTWVRAGLAVAAAAALAPGWSGRLVPVEHDAVLAAASRASSSIGVSRDGSGRGDSWHAQYLDSGFARFLCDAGFRRSATRLVPPDFVAHIPGPVGPVPLATRADGYFAVETALRWPWWRPGGGVDWTVPAE